MDFLIKALGLDKKLRATLLEYVLYISIAAALCLHLGGTLIAFGQVLVILSGAINELTLFITGSLGIMSAIEQVKLKLAQIHPILTGASPDIHYCMAAIGAGIIYIRVKLNHIEHSEAIKAVQNEPNLTPAPIETQKPEVK
jgi:hypothetical protein